MNTQETITTAIQSNDIENMLPAYQRYTGKESMTFDDLFNFLTFPSADREEFLLTYCSCQYQPSGQILSLNYTVK